MFGICQLKIVFRWRPNITEPIYWEILNKFIDKRHSSYSIHQIGLSTKSFQLTRLFVVVVFSTNGKFRRQRNRTMVWSEYDRTSSSVEKEKAMQISSEKYSFLDELQRMNSINK